MKKIVLAIIMSLNCHALLALPKTTSESMLEDVNIMILSELSASDTLESWDSDRRQYAFDLVKKEADYEAAWNLVSGDFYSYTQREWFASALSALLVLEKPDDVIEIIDRLNSGEILDNNAQKVAWSVKYGTTDLVKKAYVAKNLLRILYRRKSKALFLWFYLVFIVRTISKMQLLCLISK